MGEERGSLCRTARLALPPPAARALTSFLVMGVASSRREPVGVMLLGLDAVGETTLLQAAQLGGSTRTS